jgi:hypothetical protein
MAKTITESTEDSAREIERELRPYGPNDEREWYRRDTPATIRRVAFHMMACGLSKVATAWAIDEVVRAIREEYGE